MTLIRITLKLRHHKLAITPLFNQFQFASSTTRILATEMSKIELHCFFKLFVNCAYSSIFFVFQMLLWTHFRTAQILNGSKSYGPRGNMVPQQMYSGVSDRRLWHIGIPGRASPFQGTSKSAYRIKTYLPLSILDFLFLHTNF